MALSMLQISDTLALNSSADATLAASILNDPSKTIRLPKRLQVNVAHTQDITLQSVLSQLRIRLSMAENTAEHQHQSLILHSVTPVFVATDTMAYLLSCMPNLESLEVANVFLQGDGTPLVEALRQFPNILSIDIDKCHWRRDAEQPWHDLFDFLLSQENLAETVLPRLQTVRWKHRTNRVEHINDFVPARNLPLRYTSQRLRRLRSMIEFDIEEPGSLSDSSLAGNDQEDFGVLKTLCWGKFMALTERESRAIARVLQAPDSSIESLTLGIVSGGKGGGITQPIWDSLRLHNNNNIHNLKSITLNTAEDETSRKEISKHLCEILKDDNFDLEHCRIAARRRRAAGQETNSDADLYYRRAQFYLKLNRLGRRRLLRGTDTSLDEWADVLVSKQHDTSIVYYLLRRNPSILQN